MRVQLAWRVSNMQTALIEERERLSLGTYVPVCTRVCICTYTRRIPPIVALLSRAHIHAYACNVCVRFEMHKRPSQRTASRRAPNERWMADCSRRAGSKSYFCRTGYINVIMYLFTSGYIYLYACMHAYLHTYTRTLMHTHIHTHTYIYVDVCIRSMPD